MSATILSYAHRAAFVSFLLMSVSATQAGDAVKVKASNCALAPQERALSGFVLNRTAGIVTALHGVADCARIIVMQRTRNISFEVRVSRVAIRHDLALLTPSDAQGSADFGKIEAFEPVSDTDVVKAHDAVTAVGYPHGVLTPQENDQLKLGVPTMERLGDIMGTNQLDLIARKSPDPELEVFKISGLIVKGESGAPLAVRNANGRVIGVVIGSADPGASNIGWVMPLRNMAWDIPTSNPWSGSRLPSSLASAVGLEQEGQSHEYIVTLSSPGREDFRFSVTLASTGALEKVVPAPGTWQTVTIRDAATNVIVAEARVGQPLKFDDSRGGNHEVDISNASGTIAVGVVNKRPNPPVISVQ